MPRLARDVRTNFSSGFLDNLMVARGDINIYNQGCKQLENYITLVQGGARRRPGTDYLADVGVDGRLEDFTFSLDQRYIFVFGEQLVKIYDESGTLLQTITSMPWTLAKQRELSVTQRADVMFVAHEDFETVQITRTGATTFATSNYAYEAHSTGWPKYLPFFPFQSPNVTITPSAETGSITVTSSANYFHADMIGDVIRYEMPEGTEGYKQIEITGFTDAQNVTATVRETLEVGSATTASVLWEHQAFSEYWGWPKTVEFHAGRLWFGGSKSLPATIFGSKAAAFFNHDVDNATDDDAIAVTIDSDKVNEIRHIKSSRHLQIFTDQGEFYVPETEASPITPKTISIQKSTNYGSCRNKPNVFDVSTIFVQRTGRVVREMVWNEIERGYDANPISLPATSIIRGIRDVGVLYGTRERPEQYAFMINGDGTMAVFTSVRNENIRGWMFWTTDGKYRSVTQTGDEVFFLVERTIDGATKYFLERMNQDTTLDCAVHFSSASATVNLTGATHLANDTARVVTGDNDSNDNKYDLGEYAVDASGNITLDDGFDAKVAYIGKFYEGIIEPMSPEISTQEGRMTAEVRRIVSCTVISDDTLDYEVQGNQLITRKVNDDMSNPPEAVTGARKFYINGYNRRPTVVIRNNHALPCTILGLAMDVMY